MKFNLIFIFIFSLLISHLAKSQYSNLLDFTGTANGKNPESNLVYDGTFLYGTTLRGGNSDLGVIFKIKPDGSGFTKLFDFAAGTTKGQEPYGSLYFFNSFLYGMTYKGGTNNQGIIYKIKTDGTGFVKVMDFSGTTKGSNPGGSLISDGTFLYGMTYYGGTNNMGVIFKVKPDGTSFSKLLDFAGTSNGKYPWGTLISDSTYLYGTTVEGGTNNDGVIFKIKPDGTGFSKLLDFSGTLNGRSAWGSLISNGNYLYGMTTAGGVNNSGVIYKIKVDGTGYSKLFDFSTNDGINPYGSLISDGNSVFGMTSKGGSNTNGVLFKIKTDGSGYTKLFDFGGTNGSTPMGSLIFDGRFLYGMTYDGGSFNFGKVFRYDLATISMEIVGVPFCSNQCAGSVKASLTVGIPPFSYSWNTIPVQSTQIATGLCPGSYAITITDSSGFSKSDSVTVYAIPLPPAPQICLIDIDSLSNYNYILWDKSNYTTGDTFIVYRDTANNNYAPIGKIPYDSLSQFVDTVRTFYAANGDPNISSWRYKIAVKDTCGNTSLMSPYHQTIFFQNNNGNFNWSQYQIEGQSLPIPALSNYKFLRDNFSNGNYSVISTLSASSTLFTDLNYDIYKSTGTWRVNTEWSISCTPTLRTFVKTIKTTHSNTYKTTTPTGVSENEFENSIIISPNPTHGIFYVELNIIKSEIKGTEVKIYNILGENVYSNKIHDTKSILNLDIPDGIYFLCLRTEKRVEVNMIVITR